MISIRRVFFKLTIVRIHPSNFSPYFTFNEDFQEWLDGLNGEYHFEVTYNESHPLSVGPGPALLSAVIESGDMDNMKYADGRTVDMFFCSTDENELLFKLTWF